MVLEGRGEVIGLALRDRAEHPAPVAPLGLHPPQMGQHQIVGPALQQVVKKPVGEFRRVAEGRALGGQARRMRVLGEHQPEPEAGEEGGIEGVIGMGQEGPVETQGRRRPRHWPARGRCRRRQGERTDQVQPPRVHRDRLL